MIRLVPSYHSFFLAPLSESYDQCFGLYVIVLPCTTKVKILHEVNLVNDLLLLGKILAGVSCVQEHMTKY